MRISIPIPGIRTMSEAERRREAAKERAAKSREQAKTKADVDAAVVNALASLIADDGRVDATFRWNAILKLARDDLDDQGYGRERAIELLRARFDPADATTH